MNFNMLPLFPRIFSLFLLTCTLPIYCQHDTYKITLDFNKMELCPLPEEIKRGDFYRIEIKNINLNLFKVSLNTSDTVLSPALQTPTFGDIPVDAISSVVGGINELFVNLPQVIEGFDGTKSFANINTKEEILDEFQRDRALLVGYADEFKPIAFQIEDIKLNVYAYRLNALSIDNPPTQNESIKTLLEKIISIRRKLRDLDTRAKESKMKYDLFLKNIPEELKKDAAIGQEEKDVSKRYSELLNLYAKTLDSINPDKTNELLQSIVFLNNNSDFSYSSPPIQFNGDQAIIDLSIVPRDEKYLQNTYKSRIVFPVYRRSYKAIGLSFYWGIIHDDAYSTVAADTTKFMIVEENVANSELGIAALMRFGRKSKDKNLGWHLTFGPGVSISKDIKPRVLVGGGFTFGDKHRLALDLGLIAGYVDRLSSALDTSTLFNERPESVVVSSLSTGVFISIGYLFII